MIKEVLKKAVPYCPKLKSAICKLTERLMQRTQNSINDTNILTLFVLQLKDSRLEN